MTPPPTPTERELEILQILWERGEASVREVYEVLRDELPIVQNTVQAFLRTMEEKGLVTHHIKGRSFIYKPQVRRERTRKRLVEQLMHRAFDGAVDQLVQSAFAIRRPTAKELEKLEAMLDELKQQSPGKRKSEDSP